MQKATNKVVELKPQDDREPWEVEWERCKPLIAESMKYQDSYTIDDIEDKIKHGIALLWPGKETAVVTEFVIFPQIKSINILCVGGKYEELEEMLKSIEDYCKKIGIQRIYGGGRKGWLRKVKHLGYKKEYLISKDL